MATNPLKRHSAEMTDGPSRAPARAMLKAIGFTDDDLAKPLIGVATTWIETMPCNYNQRELAKYVKEGIREAGGTPMEFNTISVSDGVAMGTEGMRGSLVSREVIADSIETVARGHSFDGLVRARRLRQDAPGGRDGARAAQPARSRLLQRLHLCPGKLDGRDITILDVFEAVGAHGAGRIDDARLKAVEDAACPGAGACGGQFTANTMAMALEFLGISPAGANAVPAVFDAKAEAARNAGRLVDGPPPQRHDAPRHHDARGVRERHRRRRRDRGLDERGAPRARDSARGGRPPLHRRLRRDRVAHAHRREHETRRRVQRGGPVQRPVATASSRRSSSARSWRTRAQPT